MLAVLPVLAGPRADPRANPEAGHVTYTSQCLLCHGPQGAGDGPAAPGLNPPPPALNTAAFWSGRTDEALMTRIRNGQPGGHMPPFPGLSRTDLENLVAWLHTLEPRD
jgi:high-affinity iron transporter